MAVKRRQPGQTRQAILDAAERQFAVSGYHGASIREIFKEAHVGIGLMAYYFASKECLFEEVINRKIEDVRAVFSEKFDQIEERADVPPHLIFKMYLEFFLIDLNLQDENIKSYWNLLSRISISYDDEIVRKCFAKFDFMAERVAGALQRAVPYAAARKIRSALVLAEAAVTTLNAADGLFSHRLGEGEDIRGCIEQYAAMFAYSIQQ